MAPDGYRFERFILDPEDRQLRRDGVAVEISSRYFDALALLGRRLPGGSLDLLAQVFPASRLRLDRIGTLLGEPGLGPVSQAATGAPEGALFAGCLVGMRW